MTVFGVLGHISSTLTAGSNNEPPLLFNRSKLFDLMFPCLALPFPFAGAESD
jgi:hypothetical protein